MSGARAAAPTPSTGARAVSRAAAPAPDAGAPAALRTAAPDTRTGAPPATGAEPPAVGAKLPISVAAPPAAGAEPPIPGAEPPAAVVEPPARRGAGAAPAGRAATGGRRAVIGSRTFPLAVFVLALALRCGFALAAGFSTAPPAWGDDPDYDAIARGLTGPAHVYENSWFPPGYPLFLAMIYGVFGPSPAAVRIVQAVLSAATCWVAYAVARNAFGERAGQVTGVLLALYPGHIYMAWRLMAETLFTLLVALAVLAAQRAVARGGPPAAPAVTGERGRRGRRAWLAAGAGLALGTATLVKSNLIVLAPLLLLWLAFAMPRQGRRQAAAGAAMAAMAAMAAGCALPLLAAPLASRLSPAHRASWLPGNGGPTLWWSNNPLADGYFVDPDNTSAGRDFINRHGQAAAALESRDPLVRDHADRDLALAWVHEHPGAFVRLVGQKLWNAFGPLPRTALFTRDAVAARVQAIAYGVVLPLVLAGLWQSRRRCREAMPLYLVLASYIAMTVVFYGTPRFTLLVMPFMLAFAGLALADAAARWDRQPSVAAPASGVVHERPVGSPLGKTDSALRPPFSARRARPAPLDAGAHSAQGES